MSQEIECSVCHRYVENENGISICTGCDLKCGDCQCNSID